MESDLGGAVVKDESSDFETILSVKKIKKNSELILACFRSSHLEGILVTITIDAAKQFLDFFSLICFRLAQNLSLAHFSFSICFDREFCYVLWI